MEHTCLPQEGRKPGVPDESMSADAQILCCFNVRKRIIDEESLPWGGLSSIKGGLKESCIGLRNTDFTGIDDSREVIGDAQGLEIACQA
jgi:hypothetical protein